MRRLTILFGLLAATVVLAAPAGAAAATSHECQHPVQTGVEISQLQHVTVAVACPVALHLYAWENQGRHASRLYGCHRPAGGGAGSPYLRMTTFAGWHLSLHGPYHYGFQMSRGDQSFFVGGTDFPVNCT